MGKYDPLRRHLEELTRSSVPMTFREIEGILGFALPASAKRHRAWWSNNPFNNVMTRAWLDAGFETEAVDLQERKLVFRRLKAVERAPTGRHPLFGSLAGTVTFAPGFEATEPADPEWGAAAYGQP